MPPSEMNYRRVFYWDYNSIDAVVANDQQLTNLIGGSGMDSIRTQPDTNGTLMIMLSLSGINIGGHYRRGCGGLLVLNKATVSDPTHPILLAAQKGDGFSETNYQIDYIEFDGDTGFSIRFVDDDAPILGVVAERLTLGIVEEDAESEED